MIDKELAAVLDASRTALIGSVARLTDAQSRSRLVPSLTTPIALVKHCAAAERVWFQRTVAGLAEAECDGYLLSKLFVRPERPPRTPVR